MADHGDISRKGKIGQVSVTISLALLATLTISTVSIFATAEPVQAKKICKKENRYGQCTVWEEVEDSGSPEESEPSEPEEGATRTQVRLSNQCGHIQAELYPCSDLDPCDEGDDFSHREVSLRDQEYRTGQWRPTSEWYFASPFVQCRQVGGEVTEEDVRQAVIEFGMKVGDIQAAPPGGKTLVNFDTIVWTEQGPYDFDLEVLGTPIQLRAAPVAYHWDFDDGNTATFDTPGVAYAKGRPMDDYHTHTYERTGSFDVSLTVEYQVEWNAGDGWQPITGTISSEPGQFALDVGEKRDRLRDGG